MMVAMLIFWAAVTALAVVSYRTARRHHKMPVDDRPTVRSAWRDTREGFRELLYD